MKNIRTAIIGLAIALIATYAFSQLFTTFGQWDDEGYFLQAYRDVLSGRVLYDQVFAIYGPLTFFVGAAMARFHAANVTHDLFRWITLPAWVAIAVLLSGVVWRLTRQFSAALSVLLLIGFNLRGLSKGIGHPQLWIILVVALLLWLGLGWISDEDEKWSALRTGAFIGAIVLFKINIGIFVAIALCLTLGACLRGFAGKLISGLSVLAASGIGLGLLLTNTSKTEKLFVMAYMVSVYATVGIAVFSRGVVRRSAPGLKWFAAGLGCCLAVGAVATLAEGSTPQGVYYSYVTAPALFVGAFHYPFREPSQKFSLLILLCGFLVIALAYGPMAQLRRLGWLKVIVGGCLLCLFCWDFRIALTGSLLFLWLLVADVPRSARAYPTRLFLALVAALFALQLYPMAGEQVDWGALLPVVAAGVLLGDGLNSLHEVRPVRYARLAAVVLAVFLFGLLGVRTRSGVRLWLGSEPVDLPGTHWLRLPVAETTRIRSVVAAISANCNTVLLVPGLYSYSIWSGVPSIGKQRINNWLFLWPESVGSELEVVQNVGGCVFVSPDMYTFFKYLGRSPGNDELLSRAYLMDMVASGPDSRVISGGAWKLFREGK